jgi:3-hydroxyisobutyrate dehydrogenase-like beta-hydroxyacid dehydrogenase
MSKGTIGFVGIGMMGLPITTRLLAAGYDVVAYDMRKEAVDSIIAKGAQAASSPADVASKSETVLVSLPMPDIVKDVAFGKNGVASGNRRRVFVDLSTTGPRVAEGISREFSNHGVVAIDAPVSGGVSGAEKGTLAVMVSGPKAECDKLRPVFDIIGKYFWVGDKPGQGQMMKLMNNLLSATAMAATAEAIVLGVKAGLDPTIMCEVINAGSGMNTATRDKFPKAVIPRTFDVGFATGLMTKDVMLALAEADHHKMPMGIGNAVKATWLQTLAKEGAASDMSRIVEMMEETAGVTVGRSDGGAAKT